MPVFRLFLSLLVSVILLPLLTGCGGEHKPLPVADVTADTRTPSDPDIPSDILDDTIGDSAGGDQAETDSQTADNSAADVHSTETHIDSHDEDVAEPLPRMYRTETGVILTQQGERLYLRGLNIDNASKYTDGFIVNITDDELARLPSQGINSVRLLTFWNALAPTAAGVYDDEYVGRYVELVDKLTSLGLYVILDMHQDLWGSPFEVHGAPNWACPDELKLGYAASEPWWSNYLSKQVTACFDNFWSSPELQDHYASAWAHLAEQVCNNPLVIGFDLMNEPYGGSFISDSSFESAKLYGLYRRCMDAIEASCPGRLYFLEHSWTYWLGILDPMPLEPAYQDRVVFSAHYYRPELHDPDGTGYELSFEQLSGYFNALWTDYTAAGWPLWLGEFGGFTDRPGYAQFMEHTHRYLEDLGVGSALYDWGKRDIGFALVDSSGNLKPVFDSTYLTPLPTLLPGSSASHKTNFATGRVDASFICQPGAKAEWLLPGADSCLCTHTPLAALTHVEQSATLGRWTCTAADQVVQSCSCDAGDRQQLAPAGHYRSR